MSKLVTHIKRIALALCFAPPVVSWAAVDYAGTDYEPWSYSAGCVVWRATSGQLFHASTVADVAADGTIGATYNLGSSGHPWNVFASTVNNAANPNYTSPGLTLVFDEAGYNASSDAQFAPLSFGGIWVKSLQAENTPYCITDNKTDGTDRKVELGATDASTYFKFDESFTFNRNSATEVKGTATVEIATGKTFTINARANKGAVVESGNTLVLKGEGTLAVVAGLTVAVGGTLDLSASTRPTIDGDVGLYGTIVLPEGTEVSQELPFTVCSGTLSGLNVYVKIGNAEAVEKSFTAVGGAITSFGEPIHEFKDNFPTEIPVGVTYTFIGGEAEATTVTVPHTVKVSGTLKTSGFITVPYLAVNTAATLDVVDGTTTLTCGGRALAANLKVEAGATLVNGNTDAVDYYATFTANIYGTLDMGATRWSLGSNNTLNFYEDCTVTGSGQSGNGTFDWIEDVTATMNVYGNVNLQAPIKIRGSATVNVNVDTTDQKGLTLAGTIGGGKIVKKGAGLIKFTTNPPYAITVENGAFTFGVDATPTITYSAKPGTGTTMSMWYATQATWKGTVVLGVLSAPADLPLDTYGNANSKIVLKGTTGNCYLNGTTTVDAEVVIDTEGDNVVEFNNGNSGQIGTFSKISGAGTLKLTAWSNSSGVTYNINTLDGFTGTLAINNTITRAAGGTMTIGLSNIVTTGDTTPGSKVLNLTKTEVSGTTGTVVYNTSSAQVNGEAAKLAVTANGVYVAVASTTIGGVTAYYNEIAAAFNAVSAGSAGDTLTILDGNEYGSIEGFEYDSETKTYTKQQMVAQFTSGETTHQYPTIAGACADAETVDPVPTVVLLVALGEQTVPSGWEYNTPEASSTTYGTLTKVAYPSYIDPTDAAAVAKYNAWATYVGVTPATAADLKEAYLLNCRPSEVEVAKAAFTFTAIYQDGEGKWVVAAI